MPENSFTVSPATYCCAMSVPSPLSGKMPTHSVSFQLRVAMRSSQPWIATPASTNSRSAMRTSFHMRALRPRLLRLQPGDRPGARREGAVARGAQAARPAGTVVDARLALDPQLHHIRPQTIAPPVGRARDSDPHRVIGAGAAGRGCAEASRHGGDGAEERRSRADRFALLTRPGTHTALPGARGEVGVAVPCGCLLDLPFD